jgi:biopolymer transport protein ExbD
MPFKIRRRSSGVQDIPMGPMIDMVFLLLVFFMVSAKPIKPEADVGLELPGKVEQSESLDLPDEQRIEILANGQIVLNGSNLDGPGSTTLPQLTALMRRYKEASERNKTDPLITILADDETRHQRIIDVMNVMAALQITGVTIVTEEEDGF